MTDCFFTIFFVINLVNFVSIYSDNFDEVFTQNTHSLVIYMRTVCFGFICRVGVTKVIAINNQEAKIKW